MMAYAKPNYINSSFYKDSSDSARKSYDAALKKDKTEYYSIFGSSGATLGTLVGSIFGQGELGGAIGAVSGYGIGGIVNLIRGDKAIFTTSSRDELQSQLISYRNTLYGNAETAMNARSTNLYDMKRLGNNLKAQFDYNYGTGMFDELQNALSEILNLSDGKNIYDTLSSLNPDTVVGQLASRLVYNDTDVFSDTSAFTQQDYENILEKYVSLGDLGSEYTKYIVEIAQQSGASGNDLKNLSMQLDYSQEDYLSKMNDIGSEFSKMFSDAFISKVQSDIESEINIGESEARISGFKNKNGSASTKYQKYRKDLSDVAYLTMMQMYRKNLESQVNSLDVSRQRTYYEYQRQLLSMQMNIESQINESLNNYVYGIGTNLKKAYELESEEASSIAAAIAYNDQIGKYNSDYKKTYDIEGITVN